MTVVEVAVVTTIAAVVEEALIVVAGTLTGAIHEDLAGLRHGALTRVIVEDSGVVRGRSIHIPQEDAAEGGETRLGVGRLPSQNRYQLAQVVQSQDHHVDGMLRNHDHHHHAQEHLPVDQLRLRDTDAVVMIEIGATDLEVQIVGPGIVLIHLQSQDRGHRHVRGEGIPAVSAARHDRTHEARRVAEIRRPCLDRALRRQCPRT